MAKQQNQETWFKPKDKPEKVCGCVYSLVGYLIYACPKHENKAA